MGKDILEAGVDAVKDAGDEPEAPAEMSKSAAMAWMKDPQLPSFEFNIESLMPKSISHLISGKVDLTFELTGPGASALDSAPVMHKAVLDALVGEDGSVLASINSKLKKLALMLKKDDDYDEEDDDEKAMKGVTKGGGADEPRTLTYSVEEGALKDEVKNGGKDVDGEFVRFGFGGSTKYSQSIVKILEDLPTRLEEAKKLIENIVKDPETYVSITGDPAKIKFPSYHALDLPRIPVTFMQYSKLVTTLPIAVKRAVQSIMQALVYAILAFRDPATYALAALGADDKMVIAVPEDMGAAYAAKPAAQGKKEKEPKAKSEKGTGVCALL